MVNAIQSKRTLKRVTQEDLAVYLSVDRSTIAKWETGMSVPRAGTLKKLAAYFGCTIDELLTDETERKS
ncbi:MAG TPA: hypothetical protein DDW30_05425 [Clostridiales bacterium]|nr:hypothetical protein [Clostridiales bacterium]